MIAYRKRQPYISLVNSYLIDSPQPSSINYWYNLGSLLGLCLVIQIASGIFLAMHYSSHIELAFDSVEHIMRDVNLGWLIRYIHANGASFFFACMYIHVGKALYYGSYRKPRVLVWIIGVIILIATMATAFMGYCLVYGQMSHWGATVITNLLSAIPFIGADIVPFIWGGFSVSNPTIQRFFALHYLLPFVLAALVVLHLIALHVHGSSNPIGITGNMDRLSMHPYFIFKDAITVFVFLIFLCFFVFFSPNTLGQGRPLLMIIILLLLILQCAICWKYLFQNYYKTINISGLLLIIKKRIYNYGNPFIVKYCNNEYNQQITNLFNKDVNLLNLEEVEISETIRTQKYNLNKKWNEKKEERKFNQWLAGLIDGDGYLGITEGKYTCCEITVGLEDEKMLVKIQDKLGGSVKLRSGSNSIRYRLQNKPGMIKLINRINGNIRNSKRLVQLNKVCLLLDIEVKNPCKLTKDNNWFSGFFDADGTINYYYYNERPQLFISVTNKYLVDVEDFKNILGGSINFDKSQNGYYKWVITNEYNHKVFYEYILNNPSRSYKGNKIYLVPEFYKLYNLKAYKKDNSLMYNAWLNFSKKWNSYAYKFK